MCLLPRPLLPLSRDRPQTEISKVPQFVESPSNHRHIKYMTHRFSKTGLRSDWCSFVCFIYCMQGKILRPFKFRRTLPSKHIVTVPPAARTDNWGATFLQDVTDIAADDWTGYTKLWDPGRSEIIVMGDTFLVSVSQRQTAMARSNRKCELSPTWGGGYFGAGNAMLGGEWYECAALFRGSN